MTTTEVTSRDLTARGRRAAGIARRPGAGGGDEGDCRGGKPDKAGENERRIADALGVPPRDGFLQSHHTARVAPNMRPTTPPGGGPRTHRVQRVGGGPAGQAMSWRRVVRAARTLRPVT